MKYDHQSELFLPRGRKEINGKRILSLAPHQALLMGGGAAPGAADLIQMQFNDTVGTQTYTDNGSVAKTWTGGANALISNTATVPEGSAYLRLNGIGVTLTTPNISALQMGSSNFFLGFYSKGLPPVVTRYLAGMQGAVGTGADTGWAWYVGTSNVLFFIISDGTTRTVHNTGLTYNDTTNNYLAVERIGNTIYPSLGGTVGTTLAFSGSVNVPAGIPITFGAQLAGSQPPEQFIDLIQYRLQSAKGGANFTPPTSLIP